MEQVVHFEIEKEEVTGDEKSVCGITAEFFTYDIENATCKSCIEIEKKTRAGEPKFDEENYENRVLSAAEEVYELIKDDPSFEKETKELLETIELEREILENEEQS